MYKERIFQEWLSAKNVFGNQGERTRVRQPDIQYSGGFKRPIAGTSASQQAPSGVIKRLQPGGIRHEVNETAGDMIMSSESMGKDGESVLNRLAS